MAKSPVNRAPVSPETTGTHSLFRPNTSLLYTERAAHFSPRLRGMAVSSLCLCHFPQQGHPPDNGPMSTLSMSRCAALAIRAFLS